MRATQAVGATLAFALALLAPPGVRGQSTDLTGTVVDSLTNEVLPSVLVSLGESSFGVLTDAFGRFAFVGLPAGPVQLTIEHLSYRTRVLELSEVPTDPLRVMLPPDAIELAGIRVRAQTQVMDAGRGISKVSIAPEQIQVLPSLGEPDIFRSLQLLPGVSGTNDATSGLFVRGGTPDENLVLLDGMTVYHVDHFFGIFSAFNADAIKDVQLYKSAYPARYGGRTSSVVNMIGRAGDPQAFRMSAGANLLSGRTAAEIPLGDAAALMVSARRSYTDVIQSGLFNNLFNTLTDAEGSGHTAACRLRRPSQAIRGPGGYPLVLLLRRERQADMDSIAPRRGRGEPLRRGGQSGPVLRGPGRPVPWQYP